MSAYVFRERFRYGTIFVTEIEMFGHISLSLCVYSAKDKVTVWNGILYFSDALHRPAQPGFFSQLGHLHFDLHFKEIGVGTTQAQLLIFRASVREAKILDPHHFT